MSVGHTSLSQHAQNIDTIEEGGQLAAVLCPEVPKLQARSLRLDQRPCKVLRPDAIVAGNVQTETWTLDLPAPGIIHSLADHALTCRLARTGACRLFAVENIIHRVHRMNQSGILSVVGLHTAPTDQWEEARPCLNS